MNKNHNSENFILAVNKPVGITSFDVIRKLKKQLNLNKKNKIGHLGTLDPFASGILLIAFGNNCKLMSFGEQVSKTYKAIGTVGIKTDSGDLDGEVIQTNENIKINSGVIKNCFNDFPKKYSQIPPFYSAVKHEGKPLYKWAREGIFITKEPVVRTIHSLDFISIIESNITFLTSVSSGTYIRTLFEDICNKFEAIGHLISLVRVNIGKISLEQTIELDQITTDNIDDFKLSMEDIFDFESINLSDDDSLLFSLGRSNFDIKKYCNKEGHYWIKDISNIILAKVTIDSNYVMTQRITFNLFHKTFA